MSNISYHYQQARKLRKYKERRLDGFHGGPNMGENLADVLNSIEVEDDTSDAEEEFIDPDAAIVTKVKRWDRDTHQIMFLWFQLWWARTFVQLLILSSFNALLILPIPALTWVHPSLSRRPSSHWTTLTMISMSSVMKKPTKSALYTRGMLVVWALSSQSNFCHYHNIMAKVFRV